MSWYPAYPIQWGTSETDDKTNDALAKHISEFERVYTLVSQLFDAVNGHDHSGTSGNSKPIATSGLASILKNGFVPVGGIILWSGAANAIPTGFALCNGANGTPNLLDRFVIAAGSQYAVGTTGGETTHQLTANEVPSHTHSAWTDSQGNHNHGAYGGNAGSFQQGGGFGASGGPGPLTGFTAYAGAHGHNIGVSSHGGGGAHNNMPPYYALCYIMRTS